MLVDHTLQIRFCFLKQLEIVIKHGGRNGVLIEGEKGRIFVSRRTLDGAPVKALKDNPLPEDAIQKVYKGLPMEGNERKAHWANFLHCHREQVEPISDVHSHMQMLNICHYGADYRFRWRWLGSGSKYCFVAYHQQRVKTFSEFCGDRKIERLIPL